MMRFHHQPSDVQQPFIHALLCAHTAVGSASVVQPETERAPIFMKLMF